jgi:hypothetical protein
LATNRPHTTGQGRQNEIRRDGKYGSSHQGKAGAIDLYLINKTANAKEQHVLSTVGRYAAAHPKEDTNNIQGVRIQDKKGNQGPSTLKVEILDTINQRVPLNNEQHDAFSVVRTDRPSTGPKDIDEQI